MGTFPDFSDPQFSGRRPLQFPSNVLSRSFATAFYRPTPGVSFPGARASSEAAPAPLAIPPAEPPRFPTSSAPAMAAQPTSPWDSIGQGINNGLANHALTLMALGAGIAQGGIGEGLALAATAAESERNRQAQQLNFLQTYNALTNGGVPPDEARAAISNPSLMRALAVKYLGPRSTANAPSAPPALANAAVSSASPPPAPAANDPGLPARAYASIAPGAPANIPAVPTAPPNVASGAAYSRSRNMWRNPDGSFFDHQGTTVA
jgi:hypothetical protein